MLRKLALNDVPQLHQLECETQIAPWSMDIFQHCFNSRGYGWAIENDECIIGFIMLSSIVGECHILNLCVKPEYQHQGYGKELLTHALDEAKKQGNDLVYLEVRRSNHPAISLYHKMGFVQISERKNYYTAREGREDALIFAMDLQIR